MKIFLRHTSEKKIGGAGGSGPSVTNVTLFFNPHPKFMQFFLISYNFLQNSSTEFFASDQVPRKKNYFSALVSTMKT